MRQFVHLYRLPLLAFLGMMILLGMWTLWSWQSDAKQTHEWRRQRAQDTFETLNAVIASMSSGEMTDWKQIETVLGSVIRNSRTLFVVVQGRHGRLLQTGNPPDFLATNSTRGELSADNLFIVWAPLQPTKIPGTWAEALDSPHMGLGLWPKSNPVMYLGVRATRDAAPTSWFWERRTPIFLALLVCILAVTAVWIADIRRRLLAEQLAAERIRTAHLEELGLAAAGLAHETKNPLGIIMGMAQQIAARRDIPPESRIMLEHIMDEVDKTSSRLGNFMSFARPYAPHLQPTDVADLCAEVAGILKPDFDSHNIGLRLHIPPAIILADTGMLRQILVNLLLNSLYASEPGSLVEIFLHRQGRRCQLVVQDQGCGIEPDLLPNIFKPYTTDSLSGHGLGLAIVRRMVESHGWRIQVASTPGQGTAMTISGMKIAREHS